MTGKNRSDYNWSEDWTAESPEDQEADAAADTIEQNAGIAEPPQKNTTFMRAVVFPVFMAAIILIFAFWGMSAWLGIV
ncbi:hypothetical protein [Acetobacter conturbans]|uniref:Uncharacterized protein n=1 Tax=Acetobacter conturbans TaxID=1737472 RepID=A0ABX0JZ22_9PROT|nr:hypothetical protein [Acetobacter conturbans]NHN88099.1 hypothetical protein [Acetobacter conturbans]